MTSAAVLGSTSGAVSEAVSRAESQLAAFWCAPEDAAGAPVAKVRASTLNFVVICAPQDADAYREATEHLSETHGGRTLLLTLSGRLAPWDLVPDIHAVCRIEGAVPVCYDRVDLTFGAVAASRAPSVVQSLALPELMTVVEVGPGAPAPLVDAVAGRFDRLLVDSSRTPLSTIARILRHAAPSDGPARPCPVADRAMVRTYAWRELTARFFDEAVDAARHVRRVEIARTRPSAAQPPPPGASLDPAPLFLGWLASRLGWSFHGRGVARDALGELVDLVLTDDDREGLPPGSLTAVRLRATLRDEPLDCTIERTTSAASVRWKMRGAANVDREHALGHKDETWVAIKCIDAREGDAVTRAALLAAADWESHR